MTAAPGEATAGAGDGEPVEPAASTHDANNALALLAVDPTGLGGVVLRGPPIPARDLWMDQFRQYLPGGRALRKVPLHVCEQRLVGGLDLAATLAAGRPVGERGLLAEADGGCLVLASAERIAPTTAAHIASALDTGLVVPRMAGSGGGPGVSDAPARFSVVAFDESGGDEEPFSAALSDRLAFRLDAGAVAAFDALGDLPDEDAVAEARVRLPGVAVSDDLLSALTAAAAALGVGSMRAPVLAVRAARASAALAGRSAADASDGALAVRLVLVPRATRYPTFETEDETPPETPPDEVPPDEAPPEPEDQSTADQDRPLEDVMIEAAKALIPAGLLAELQRQHAAKSRQTSASRAGALRRSPRFGRPAGTRPGDPRQGGRLDIVATLRAAAPWQGLRRRDRQASGDAGRPSLVEVRRSDMRLRKFKEKTGTVLIFAVDASGSAAVARLAEAKGAVELMLADCYARRDEVAVLAFRGQRPDLLLPPTRSLVRAKRALAELPGGGATPLAAALDAARELAVSARRKGRQPAIVLLTDGRGNVARDGTTGRVTGESDALAAARVLAALDIGTLVIDTSPRPQPQAAQLAQSLAARCVALPHADARRLSQVVRDELPGG